jgi:2-polyprenyl-3-methyl-5-hydroxy-6-metoxy-1,4-benzoquinol methylase
MKEELRHCPACLGNEISFQQTVKDHSTSKENFDIWSCNDCGHLFTNPRVKEGSVGPYYDNPDYISHTDDATSVFAKVYQILRGINLNWKHGYVAKYAQGKSLLDYGCGTGQFLEKMVQKGYSVQGVEINDGARAKASSFGKVFRAIEDVKGPVDAITMWHVLEHVYNLDHLLEAFKDKMSDNATLIIAVPNPESYDAKHYGVHWAAWDIPIHVHHFTKNSMKTAVERNGFKLQKVLPMSLDSYYISLISEQYKEAAPAKKLKHWLHGLIQGTISNIKGGKDNKSSLIYVFKNA